MPTKTPITAAHCRSCAIRQACLLGQVGDTERALVEPQIRQRTFHSGDALVEEGIVAGALLIIKLGTAFAYRRGLDGRSRPIGVIHRGNAFGIFGIFEYRNQASGIAMTTVRACEIPIAAVRDLSECGSKFLVHVLRAVTENFAAMAAWAEAMRLSGVTNQLAYVIVLLAEAAKSPVVELPSHVALAEMLGTRRETIARALRTLDEEGGLRRAERRRYEVDRSRLLTRLAQARNEERE